MKVEFFHIGPFTVYGYGLMIAIGVVLAFLVAEKRAPGKGLNADQVFNLGIWCLIGGIIGAKLMYYIVEFPQILKDPSILWHFSDGFVVYGGIILGILTGYLYCRKKKLVFIKYFDLVMPSIALAQAFGRLGCLMAGCCYGRETDSWFSITFQESPFAPNGVALIPTRIMSSVADFLNFAILLVVAKKAKSDGQVAGMYLILYSIGRFFLECFRGDPRGSVGVLSTSQFIAIFILAVGIAVYLYCTKKYPKNASEKTEEN